MARDPAVLMSIYTVTGTGASVMVGNSREEVQAVFAAAQQLRLTEVAGQNNATAATNEVIARLIIANPSMSPATAGAAGGIASGIVAVLAEAERGRFVPIRKQPDPTALKRLVVVASSKQ